MANVQSKIKIWDRIANALEHEPPERSLIILKVLDELNNFVFD